MGGAVRVLSRSEEQVGGDPISLKDLKEESLQAFYALTLFDALSREDAGSIRQRINPSPESIQGLDHQDRPKGPKGKFMRGLLDGQDAGAILQRGSELVDDEVFLVGLSALETRVREKVEVSLTFGSDPSHPSPLAGSYRPFPVLMPQDLLAACWLQLCAHMADVGSEWRYCLGYGLPFQVTRKDQTTSPRSQACQKTRQRRQKRERKGR